MSKAPRDVSSPEAHSHAHPHTHSHAHEHEHEHEHEQEHVAPLGERQALQRGAGAGKILFFDCFSGVAGDMTIAALHDLGVPRAVFEDSVAKLPLSGFELVWGQVERSGIVGVRFDVRVAGDQPLRGFRAIDDMLRGSALDARVGVLACAIFRRLGEAEARAHRVPLADVHFHEVGAVDAIVDIVGTAAGLAYLGADVMCSPLPMGRGFVGAAHGVLPLPAPAVVGCLADAPTYGVDLDAELVTPTGAAIVAEAAVGYARWPAMTPEHVGYGAGSMRLLDRPNLLRLVMGARADDADEPRYSLLEANVDDITGELASHALGALLTAGAVDAWATPITMKKGRPGLVLSALAPHAAASRVEDALLRETTTIGVRSTPQGRVERTRETIEVETRYGALPVKISGGGLTPAQVKPEFDRCVQAAEAHGVPVRLVLQAVLAAYDARRS